jgi:hypothetical protein
MLYSVIKNNIDSMIEDISAGKEECFEILSYNLIRDQNVPITIKAKLLYPLNQIKIVIYCPFLLVDHEVDFSEVLFMDSDDDYIKVLQLVSKFTTTLEMLKHWIEREVPDMIRWGEGVIFDKNGRTKKIPLNLFKLKA